MGSQSRPGQGSGARILSLKAGNKLKRQALFVSQKKSADKARHDLRRSRAKLERGDPELRQRRLVVNQPSSIDKKRIWDDVDDDSLGNVVDVALLKRRRVEAEEAREAVRDQQGDSASTDAGAGNDDAAAGGGEGVVKRGDRDLEDDADSMLASDDEQAGDEAFTKRTGSLAPSLAPSAAPSVAPSTTSTYLDLTPDSLARQFPQLFNDEPLPPPKILVTTSLNATIHSEAQEIASVFPNSTYIRRSAHRYSHKYSVREIAKFAKNRGYTVLVVITEDLKTPSCMTICHLNGEGVPPGPTLTYSISNWMTYKKLPGHGNPTNHYPELLLTGFKTPLGILAARSYQTIFPPAPELQGRQVTSLTCQRDFIFLRLHRYVFREVKGKEKNVVGSDGKDIQGMQGIRAGLQELGPRMTLKLRRVDKGVGRAGSEGGDAMPWKWKSKMDVKRTRFQL